MEGGKDEEEKKKERAEMREGKGCVMAIGGWTPIHLEGCIKDVH